MPPAAPVWRGATERFRALGTSVRRWLVGNRPGSDASRWRRIWWYARLPVFALSATVLLLVGAFLYLYATVDLPDRRTVPVSSVVLDAQGRELATISGEEFRRSVGLDEIAPEVVDALLATEDRRFYDHPGLDLTGIVRATVSNLTGDDLQGASTITQQLVKNAFLSSERTIPRKAKEAVLALKLEQEMSKDEILETYLNTVYFGRGAYGIEAAADVYFDTTAAELEAGQAAFLVGILQAPESLDPAEAPDDAAARRDAVLEDMVDVGALEQGVSDDIHGTGIDALPPDDPVQLGEGVGAHFVDWVHQQVDAELGPGAATTEGLVIHTTVDIEHQLHAEHAVTQVLDQTDDPQAALVAIAPDGAIRAMVGGRDHDALKVNLALGADGAGSGRQAGSTFKPVALLGGLESGLALRDRFRAPATITIENGGDPYEVTNYSGHGHGSVDLEQATVDSINTVFAQVAEHVGGEAMVDVAERGGIDADLEPFLSLALGAEEVSPLGMADLYSTFARRGEHIEPFAITRIENGEGDVLFEVEREPERAYDTDTVDVLNHALQRVVARGTGTAARLDRPMAGKTGTTQNYGDAWFAGYTPDLTAVVWMGYPEGSSRAMDDVHGRRVTGGSFPAEIWKRYASEVLKDVEPTPFAEVDPSELEGAGRPTLRVLGSGPFEAGSRIGVRGRGFEDCIDGWFVAWEGREPRSEPTEGDADERSARLRIPPEASDGPHRVVAYCDKGAGPLPAAQAGLMVGDPEATTTTSSSSTTTSSSSTTSSTTTSTTTSSSTTSSSSSSTTSTTSSTSTTSTTSEPASTTSTTSSG